MDESIKVPWEEIGSMDIKEIPIWLKKTSQMKKKKHFMVTYIRSAKQLLRFEDDTK